VRLEREAEEGAYEVAVCLLDITGAQRSRLDKFVESELQGS